MSIILTGIKPTGQPHLGNYLGAILPALSLEGEFTRSLFFVADAHALVNCHNGDIREQTHEVAGVWLACGLDPSKSILYRQTDVPEIFELAWILSCFTPKGFMNRAHAYKAVITQNEEEKKKDLDHGVSMGLYSYPVLMAADILLFSATKVPVGQDQKQHLEFAKDIAQKLNHITKQQPLVLPDPIHLEQKQECLLGLDGRKMSKSYGNHIPLFCSEKKLKKLIGKIKTDSLPPDAPKDFDTSLVAQIYQAFASDEQVQLFRESFQRGIAWGEAKVQLFDLINSKIAPMRERYDVYMSDTDKIEDILAQGAAEARSVAVPKLEEIKSLLGLGKPSAG